jgi:formylglycine-generating enzyme required for sulfatase activity
MMKLINNALDGMFIIHPQNPKIKMMRHEVTQSFYEAVVGENPSACCTGNLPVESVNYEDTQKFCQQLGWISGTEIRLPTPDEFTRAIGQLEDINHSKPAWTFDNTDGLTTRNIATSAVNVYGFYDLIWNVEEWVQSNNSDAEAIILGGSVNTVVKKEIPRRIALKEKEVERWAFESFNKLKTNENTNKRVREN